jgi:ribose transport system permease protein
MGGSGHYLGTAAGALTLVLLNGLLAVLNVGPAFYEILYGVIIFATVGIAKLASAGRG